MKSRTIVGVVAGLLVTATAAANVALPGYAGVPDPLTDGAPWFFDGGRLELTNATDTSWHYFDEPLPIKASTVSTSLTVTWEHGVTCGTMCLSLGNAEVRVLSFNADGSANTTSSWSGSTGTPNQTVTIPIGGSAMLQVRMRADANGDNNQYISRSVTSGTASL